MRSVLILLGVIAAFVLIELRDSAAVSADRTMTASPSAVVERAADPRRDIYGNEVAPAVGDYRVDPYGEMYERHAPDTALLELGEPET